jgi:hypothetical protein
VKKLYQRRGKKEPNPVRLQVFHLWLRVVFPPLWPIPAGSKPPEGLFGSRPAANTKYQLVVNGKVLSGTTDKKGTLHQPVQADAREAELRIGDPILWTVQLKIVDRLPRSFKDNGEQSRLDNLGLFAGQETGEDAFANKIRSRQRFNTLLRLPADASDESWKLEESEHGS